MREAYAFRIRHLALPFYLPAGFLAIATGMIVPVLPLYAQELGAGMGVSGAMIGMVPLGSMVAGIPAGFLVERLGRRRCIVGGIIVELAAMGGAAIAPSPLILGGTMMVVGASHAVVHIARLSIFREKVPQSHRGRAIALLGGDFRLGGSVGPVVGGFAARALGLSAAFWTAGASLAAALLFTCMWLPPQPRNSREPEGPDTGRIGWRAGNWKLTETIRSTLIRTLDLIRTNRRILATACLAIVVLTLVRIGRKSIFPLWGQAIDIDVAMIGVILGIANTVELALFYPAGMAMDRFGRKATAVPCMALLGLSILALRWVDGFGLFAAVAVLSGLGNGLGAGINMTLSTDFAPTNRSGEFIGISRTLSEIGAVSGPFAVGAIAEAAGLTAALIMLLAVPEPHRRTSTQ